MKKVISIVLLLTLCLSLFAGCQNEETPAVTYDLASAKAYLTNMYQTAGKGEVMTLTADKDLVSKVTIDGVAYEVSWAVKVTSGAAEDVKIGESTKDNHVKLDINELPETELCFTATATIKAGDGTTDTVSFDYKVAASDRPATSTNVADGTYVILYNNLTFSALAEDKSYGYAYANEVTVADGAVSGHTAADVITIKNVDDGFTMQDVYGRYIYLKGTYNSFNVGTELTDDVYAVWQLMTDKDGNQFIVNKGNMKTLAYDTGYKSWGAYPEITDTRMSSITVIAATAPEGGENPGTENPGTENPGTENPSNPGDDKPSTEKPSSLDDQIKAAMALADQAELPYTSTMTGKITKINEEYSEQYKNITVTIEYKGKSYKIFRVKGDKAAELKVGDTITVTGNLKKWYDDVELVKGKLDKVVAGTGSSTEKPADKPSTPAGTPATVKDGTYVIYVPAYNKALSSEKALNKDGSVGFYNAGVDVTVSGSTVSGAGDTEKWVIKNNADGTITISQNGKNLALADSYSSMNLGEKNDKWIVEDAGNGMIYIKNVARGNYIEWYDQFGNWSSFTTIDAGKEGLFAIKLVAV